MHVDTTPFSIGKLFAFSILNHDDSWIFNSFLLGKEQISTNILSWLMNPKLWGYVPESAHRGRKHVLVVFFSVYNWFSQN